LDRKISNARSTSLILFFVLEITGDCTLAASTAQPSPAPNEEPASEPGAAGKKSAADTEAPESAAEPVELETVIVTGRPEDYRSARPEESLEGENLRMQIANTLGKTLEQQLGVRNASFGPGVGIPVIRGLTGPRVRMLQNGLGAHDASTVSPDHAVAIEPLLAEKIQLLRGPATIRYGSGAIGGVVDVLDYRIPNGPPSNWAGGAAEMRYVDNGDEIAGVGKLDVGRDWFALHLDGFYRQRGNIEIPGAAIDQNAVEEQFGLTTVPTVYGYVPNTDLSNDGGSVGWSVSGDKGLLGMSFNTLHNDYGIPTGGHGLGHSHGDGRKHGEQVRVDMSQNRYDFKAEWFEPVRYIDKAALKIAVVDYQHSEVDLGVINTTFRNDVVEGRFELPFRPIDEMSGALGLQWINRKFSAVGTETFVPPTGIDMLAGYFTERFEYGDLALDIGLRKEQVITKPETDTQTIGGVIVVPLPDQLDYSPHSVSGALDWKITDKLLGNVTYSWSERAPDVQELLSLGPHLATRTFDVGNIDLRVESSRNLDVGLSWAGHGVQAKLTGFYNDVGNFIYLRNLGFFYDVESERFQLRCAQLDRCLPVYGYSQADATFIGYEAESSFELLETSGGLLELVLFSDFVRGRFQEKSLAAVPRMPTLRYGAQLGFGTDHWSTALRVARVEPQDDPGLNETDTPGYVMMNFTSSYRFDFDDQRSLMLFLRADNLLNQEIRNAVSFLRNFAPEPGRSIEIGLRATF
jgi:iron complex outermembrane receptor protein